MYNILASTIPFRKAAAPLAEAGMFIRLHQKTRRDPHVQKDHADYLIRHHFLLGVQGESASKLAAAGAVILPHAEKPFAEQMAGIVIPEKTALLCLTTYSTRLVGNPRRWAEEDLVEGARVVAKAQGCVGLLTISPSRDSPYRPWLLGGTIPL